MTLLWPLLAAAQATAGDVGPYLQEIKQLSEQALEASRAAQQAATVADVKAKADEVFAAIWGVPSGLDGENATGEASIHGWKTRWQVDGSEFDEAFAERYGTTPPAVADPKALGIIGRGLYVRKQLQKTVDDSTAAAADRHHAEGVITALNNVIGWMKMDDGVTKGERQPRVDLTREWDAPSAFWLSTADTGWLYEVYSQALNILKTNYEGDVATAREHAAGMTTLLEKVFNGIDADKNGSVDPVMMEGGLNVALQQATSAGYLGS